MTTMQPRTRSWAATARFAVVWAGVCLLPASGAAQQRDNFRIAGDLTPAQVQRLFDAYELVQAQEMLDLTDEQYPQFVATLNGLQEARRQTQQRRQRMLRELNRLSNQPGSDDALLEERLAELKRLNRETAETLATAYDEIDAILNVRQRVRFRMFEQQMQRRRVDMLQRARRPMNTPQRRNRPDRQDR